MMWEQSIPRTTEMLQPRDTGSETRPGSSEEPEGSDVRRLPRLWDARCQIIGRLFLLLF